jgi:hypothetical protein
MTKAAEDQFGYSQVWLGDIGAGDYFGEIALVQNTPRTATIITISKCVVLSISKSKFQKFFEVAPEAVADFEIKLARYKVELRSVVYHPEGLKYFEEHIKREYSSENIEFWKRCRDYRHLTDARYESSAADKDADKHGDKWGKDAAPDAVSPMSCDGKPNAATVRQDEQDDVPQLAADEIDTCLQVAFKFVQICFFFSVL